MAFDVAEAARALEALLARPEAKAMAEGAKGRADLASETRRWCEAYISFELEKAQGVRHDPKDPHQIMSTNDGRAEGIPSCVCRLQILGFCCLRHAYCWQVPFL